jgi:hypothetical protein
MFGPDSAVARAPSPEKPGGSLIVVSRGEGVDRPVRELERRLLKLSQQKKMSQRILEVSDQVDPRNSGASEFFTGQNPDTATAIIVSIDIPSVDFQCSAGLDIRNIDKKLTTTARLLERSDPSMEPSTVCRELRI